MTTRTKTLEAGTLAYDLAQHEPVIVTDPDVGTIAEQDNALEEMIRGNAGNQACGFDPDTQCVEIMFMNLDGRNSSTYTYPETRIGVPNVEVLEEKLTVRQFVQYETLKDLMAEALRNGPETVDMLTTLWTAAPNDQDVLDAVEAALDEDIDTYASS